jgi:hypothetical protein
MTLPVIAITNQSTVLSDDQVDAALTALQKQVTDDFRPYWGPDCTLRFLPKEEPLTKGWWQIVVLDDPDMAGALGYHELSSVGTPLGKIFAKLDMQSGSVWTVTLSHELLEMLGDPDIDTVKQCADGNFYALEVCDAVEADNLGYEIDGVLLSDFVTPQWFNEQVECERYSFKEHVSKPLELAPGGYISVFKNGEWSQLTAQSIGENANPAALVKPGSRRFRRMYSKRTGGMNLLWRKSTR